MVCGFSLPDTILTKPMIAVENQSWNNIERCVEWVCGGGGGGGAWLVHVGRQAEVAADEEQQEGQ